MRFAAQARNIGGQHEPDPETLSAGRRSSWLDRDRSDCWSRPAVQASDGCVAKHSGCGGGGSSEGGCSIYGDWTGTLDGLVNADVRAQVTGYLLKQGYQEGAFVKQGQLLFQIDPRPFQAALDQAQGQLAQAKAALANAEAV